MPVYECDGCGACCKTFPIYVAETDAEREPRIRDEGRRLPLWLATPEWTHQLFPLPFHETCCFLDGDNLFPGLAAQVLGRRQIGMPG